MMQNLSTDPLWCLTACSAIDVKEHIAELRLSTAPYHSIAPKILWDAKFGISSAFSCHGKRGSSPLSVWHWLHVFGLGRSANSRTHLSALQSNQMLQPWLEPSVRASQAGGAQVWPLWVVVDWCTQPNSWFLFPLSPIHVSSLISSPEYSFQCHLHIKLCWLYFPFTHRHSVQIVSNFCGDVINTWKHAW